MPETVPTTTARTKIGVVGAGSVGSSLAYAVLIKCVAQEVALYDLAGDRVRAEGLDLAHGAMFTPSSRVTGSDDVAVLSAALAMIRGHMNERHYEAADKALADRDA